MKWKLLFPIVCVIAVLGLSEPQAASTSCLQKGSQLAAEGKLDEGIEALRQCIKDNASDGSAHIALGYLFIQKGEMTQALKAFETALKLHPESSSAKTGKGIVLSRQGKLHDAEVVLNDALRLNPDPSRVLYELGRIHEHNGNMEQALLCFKKGISAFEQNAR